MPYRVISFNLSQFTNWVIQTPQLKYMSRMSLILAYMRLHNCDISQATQAIMEKSQKKTAKILKDEQKETKKENKESLPTTR